MKYLKKVDACNFKHVKLTTIKINYTNSSILVSIKFTFKHDEERVYTLWHQHWRQIVWSLLVNIDYAKQTFLLLYNSAIIVSLWVWSRVSRPICHLITCALVYDRAWLHDKFRFNKNELGLKFYSEILCSTLSSGTTFYNAQRRTLL